MPDPKSLPAPFDGQPVVKAGVKVRNAGDGLSKALTTDPQTLHLGERVVVLIETEVTGADIRPLDKEAPRGPVTVSYVLTATSRATIIEDDSIEDLLAAQHRRNEEAAGVLHLDLDGDGPDPVPDLAPDDDLEVPSPGIVKPPKPAKKAAAKPPVPA
jgi:hypothetical protein